MAERFIVARDPAGQHRSEIIDAFFSWLEENDIPHERCSKDIFEISNLCRLRNYAYTIVDVPDGTSPLYITIDGAQVGVAFISSVELHVTVMDAKASPAKETEEALGEGR